MPQASPLPAANCTAPCTQYPVQNPAPRVQPDVILALTRLIERRALRAAYLSANAIHSQIRTAVGDLADAIPASYYEGHFARPARVFATSAALELAKALAAHERSLEQVFEEAAQ